MIEDAIQVDNFLAEPDKVRSAGLRAQYSDRLLKDGAVYKRVCETNIPEVIDALNRAMGRPISLLGMGFRLNYEGELPNQSIHTDAGWGTYAMVLYLTPDDILLRLPETNGTMLWTHAATGTDGVTQTDIPLLLEVMDDWEDETKWQPRQLLEAKYNRASLYRSDHFHSRYPFEAFGSTPNDGRLTLVAFFD